MAKVTIVSGLGRRGSFFSVPFEVFDCEFRGRGFEGPKVVEMDTITLLGSWAPGSHPSERGGTDNDVVRLDPNYEYRADWFYRSDPWAPEGWSLYREVSNDFRGHVSVCLFRKRIPGSDLTFEPDEAYYARLRAEAAARREAEKRIIFSVRYYYSNDSSVSADGVEIPSRRVFLPGEFYPVNFPASALRYAGFNVNSGWEAREEEVSFDELLERLERLRGEWGLHEEQYFVENLEDTVAWLRKEYARFLEPAS